MMMNIISLSALVVACLFSFSHAASSLPTEGSVLVLSDDNFDTALSLHESILVEFYAPWCGHCKNLAPEWSKAADTLKDSSPIKLAKVDVTENDDLGKKYDIKGFPTIKFFKKGTPSDYQGGRTAAEIVTWVNKKSGPPAVVVNSEEELTKLQEKYEVFALGVFDSADSANFKAFNFIASNDETNVYAYTTSNEVKSKLSIDKDTVVVLKTFDEGRVDLAVGEELQIQDVTDFVTTSSIPLVQEFTPESSKKIFSSPVTKHVLFFTDKKETHHASVMETFRTVASSYKGILLFINVPSSESKILDFFAITADQIPTAVVADLGGGSGIKKFPYSGALEVAAFSEFADKFLTGQLKATLKSEEVAPEDTEGNVKVIKGKSFEDIVLNNTKDVFVEFYAPWCGHCKKLAPIWDELADKVSETHPNLVIAKMDSTANEVDVEGLEVKGFPTLYFFKGSDKKNPIKYEEGRELDDFVKYLSIHASSSVAAHEEL